MTGPRVPKVLCLRIQRLITLITYVFLADLPHRKWANMAITCSSISNWDGGEFSRLWGHLDPYSFGDQGVEVVGIEKHGLITRFQLVAGSNLDFQLFGMSYFWGGSTSGLTTPAGNWGFVRSSPGPF